jgi:hypothetical protein
VNYPKQVGEKSFVAEGRVENDTVNKETLMALYDRRFVSMDFAVNGKKYSLQPLGNNGVHVIAELVDSPPAAPCGSVLKDGAVLQGNEPPPIVSCGNQRKIRVLFLATTDAARNGFPDAVFGSIPALASEIQKQITLTNTALRQSLEWSDKASVEIEVASEQPIPWDPLSGYTESMPDLPADRRTFASEVEFLNYISDTKFENFRLSTNTFSHAAVNRRRVALNANYYIRWLRESYKPDIIAIIHNNGVPNGAGQTIAGFASQIEGYIISESGKPNIVPSANNAFLFLNSSLFTGNGNPYLLAHELGHLLGGRHHSDISDAPQFGPRFGYQDALPVAPGYDSRPTKTIMAVDGDPSVPLYSSPKIQLPGAFYAYAPTRLNADDRRDYGSIDPKNLATNQPNPLFPNSRPIGSDAVFDVTSTIERYAPTIANYQRSGVDISIDLDNIPPAPYHRTPQLDKGQSGNVILRFSGCGANTHRAQVFILGRNRILQYYDEVFVGSDRALTYQVKMPNDADYSGITGIVTLETYNGVDQPFAANYSSDTQYFSIACRNCQSSGFKALAALQSASTQNRPRNASQSESIAQVYVYPIAPNPIVSGSAELRFVLPESMEVQATLYNTLGLPVKEILRERITRGEHVTSFSTHDLPSGAYTCRITAGNHIIRQTVMIVK